MRRCKLWTWGAVAPALMVIVSEGHPQCTVTFEGLGDLPGGDFWSEAYSVSADGSTVVGQSPSTASGSDPEAFRWTRSTGMIGLGNFPGGPLRSLAWDVSEDGAVIVGQGFPPSLSEAFRWTSKTGLVGLGNLGGSNYGSSAVGVSSSGLVVVGWGNPVLPNGAQEAFRWTSGTGMVGLGHLPGPGYFSVATSVSADGSIVVGYSIVEASGPGCCFEAFRWTEAEGMVGMGDLPEGSFNGAARRITDDGSVVVGWATSEFGREAFRWTRADGMIGLGDLAGGDFSSAAVGVSANGSTVVGTSKTSLGNEAFIWTPNTGIRNLGEVLVMEHGLNLEGWILEKATAVSDDGLTIVGWGTNPQGQTEAWVARFNAADLNADGVINPFDLAILLGAWCSAVNDPNPPSPPCENCLPQQLALADITGPANAPDGCVNAYDLAALLANWGPCP